MYASSPGPGSGSGGGADPPQQSAGELLAEIFSATSSSRGRDQLDWPVHGHPSSGSSGGRVDGGEANSAAASAPTREEDAPVANNDNGPGVWLDFLSASTATSPSDNGNAPHRNARITSAPTSASQTRTPVPEGSASGDADASGLALFKMEPGDSNDADPRGGGSIEDRQKSGDA
jgi:hypothetical protein